MLLISLIFKKNVNFVVNNLRFIKIKNAKFSRSDFKMDPNIKGDFQMHMNVPLMNT